MRPSRIYEIMDLALAARLKGKVFNPCFEGEAGLGKSDIVKQWVKKQQQRNPNFGFIDLRIAYMEAPDLIGFPETVEIGGRKRTMHCLPDFWPTEGEGLLLLEEPNRGTTGVMNCLMQLLTDRKVHNYELPEGWIVAAAINPDQAEYDVNAMDVALKDRFEMFRIEYDHNSFVDFMEHAGWDQNIQLFIKSGAWTYRESGAIGDKGKYISPRTWSKLEAAEKAGARQDRQLHNQVTCSVLGKDIGNEYWKFCHDQAPVLAGDLLKDKTAALKRLGQQSSKDSYEGDKIAVTVESIIKNYGGFKKDCKADQIDEDLMCEVARVIPSDQAINLVKECGFKTKGASVANFFKEFVQRHPDLVDILKSNIRLDRAVNAQTK